eukprot:1310718-Pleurochrysis_carterae.AAC.1
MERPEGQLAPERPGTIERPPPAAHVAVTGRRHAAPGGGTAVSNNLASFQIKKTCVDHLHRLLCTS